MSLCVCRSLEYLDCVHGLFNLLQALDVAPGRNRLILFSIISYSYIYIYI